MMMKFSNEPVVLFCQKLGYAALGCRQNVLFCGKIVHLISRGSQYIKPLWMIVRTHLLETGWPNGSGSPHPKEVAFWGILYIRMGHSGAAALCGSPQAGQGRPGEGAQSCKPGTRRLRTAPSAVAALSPHAAGCTPAPPGAAPAPVLGRVLVQFGIQARLHVLASDHFSVQSECCTCNDGRDENGWWRWEGTRLVRPSSGCFVSTICICFTGRERGWGESCGRERGVGCLRLPLTLITRYQICTCVSRCQMEQLD